MLNANLFTEEEMKMIRRFNMKNEKALVKSIVRMLPCLPVEEMDTALALIGKLQESLKESRSEKAESSEKKSFLSRLTAARGYFLLSTSSQRRCFAV